MLCERASWWISSVRCEPCLSKMRRIGLPDEFFAVSCGMKHFSNHCVQRNSSVHPLGDTETLENGEFCEHWQLCFYSLDFRIDFQPSLVELLSRKHKPWLNGISCCIDALNDCDKLQVPTLLAIAWSVISWYKILFS